VVVSQRRAVPCWQTGRTKPQRSKQRQIHFQISQKRLDFETKRNSRTWACKTVAEQPHLAKMDRARVKSSGFEHLRHWISSCLLKRPWANVLQLPPNGRIRRISSRQRFEFIRKTSCHITDSNEVNHEDIRSWKFKGASEQDAGSQTSLRTRSSISRNIELTSSTCLELDHVPKS